ncbi:hypothetical protein AB0G15_06005 [Streptosporangium sp. NPDC023825]|uniref:hypothetical protein n=1 Tax=Streptosporangium sp. NPDC023825 TaxID=3154909 RepID=UPI00342565CA
MTEPSSSEVVDVDPITIETATTQINVSIKRQTISDFSADVIGLLHGYRHLITYPVLTEKATDSFTINTGSLMISGTISSEVVNDFSFALLDILRGYQASTSNRPTREARQAVENRPGRVRRKRTRPVGDHAIMRDQLRQGIKDGAVPPEIALKIRISARSSQAKATQKAYWQLVDAGKIVKGIPRPPEFASSKILDDEFAELLGLNSSETTV